jgi:hypothetical protein
MIHSRLEALNGHWDKEEYAAGYRARFSAIPDSEAVHHCWRTGWEDADTELLESARHNRILAEGREDDYADTWGAGAGVRRFSRSVCALPAIPSSARIGAFRWITGTGTGT